MSRFQIGDRVCFNRGLLKEARVVTSNPLWRVHGTVVGFFPPNYVRVKFDKEDVARTVPEDRLMKPR